MPARSVGGSRPALAVSGLPSEEFCFEGFQRPRKTVGAQKLAGVEWRGSGVRSVFESPRRLAACLSDVWQ